MGSGGYLGPITFDVGCPAGRCKVRGRHRPVADQEPAQIVLDEVGVEVHRCGGAGLLSLTVDVQSALGRSHPDVRWTPNGGRCTGAEDKGTVIDAGV